MSEPQEPPCPPGRKPHRDRVKQIDDLLTEGKTGAVCIDDTDAHRAWYLHEIAKYPRLKVVGQGVLAPGASGVWVIRVRKEPSGN